MAVRNLRYRYMTMNSEKKEFEITYEFFDEYGSTEIAMYIDGVNILGFEMEGEQRTTRWYLDDLTEWLRDFIDNMKEDPYPVEAEGEYAAEKDENARDFDSEDEDEFDAYYDKLDDWDFRHRWHPASAGAILADVYFQLVGDCVEISWDNEIQDEGAMFNTVFGGARIDKDVFVDEVNAFLKAYARHWFKV